MNHDTAPATECPNCGAALAVDPHPHYCPLCGQETRLHPPTFGEFVHEFVGHYVALEGALWRTLGALLFHPGRLTREYLDGRRRRYVLPLRVYLSASFLFFLVVKFIGAGPMAGPAVHIDASSAGESSAEVLAGAASGVGNGTAQGAATSSASAESTDLDAWVARCAAPGACSWLEARASRALKTLSGPDSAREVGWRLASAAPYAVFLMVPFFAGLLRWAWRRAGMTYGAHFVFALHLHAFAFLVLLAAELLPGTGNGLALLLILAHATLAARRIYGLGWPATLGRVALVGVGYSLLVVIGSVLLTGLVLFMATGA